MAMAARGGPSSGPAAPPRRIRDRSPVRRRRPESSGRWRRGAPPRTSEGRPQAESARPARSQATLAGESPGPPSSSLVPPARIAGGDSGAASHIPDRLGPGWSTAGSAGEGRGFSPILGEGLLSSVLGLGSPSETPPKPDLIPAHARLGRFSLAASLSDGRGEGKSFANDPGARVRESAGRADPSRASPSQANGRGAAGSTGFGGWRQGGTLPTSGTRLFSWPIPSTRP